MAFFSHIVKSLRASTRSLKTTLAVYFLPITVVPTLFISYYAIELFQESTSESVVRRATSEREAIVAEIESQENELLAQARGFARNPSLQTAALSRSRETIENAVDGLRTRAEIRIYTPDGVFLAAGRPVPAEPKGSPIPYISAEGLKRARARGETQDRYFFESSSGFVTVTRVLLKDRNRFYGVLETLYQFGPPQLLSIKNRRQVDVVLLSRDFSSAAASFALPRDALRTFATKAFQKGTPTTLAPVYVTLGEERFAGFLFDLAAQGGRVRQWGYLAVFVSMTAVDSTITKLKTALAYLTVFLVLVSALLIFLLSNRLVKPIEILVSTMKRVKTGRVEQIPPIDSTYEIEYLVRSFNEMAKNVSAAKRELEHKVEELRSANLEIKETQGTLVQSAKMISLGQIVAGVAHELNNPIAFIYSNMHHLSKYVEHFNTLVKEYRSLYDVLPTEAKSRVQALEKEIDLDFVLKDMDDLTRSCLDGANRTKEIVLGLRTFSRMDESVFRPADVHEGIRSTLRLLSSEIKGRVTIHQEFGDVPQVECNISQLNQVFMNLLSNAAHAISGRGDIYLRTSLRGETVIVEISDTGSGMSAETLDKIFDPFFTTKKIGQGTGLGLSIAYGLIQKHNGKIEVKSKLGVGTSFFIFLPVKQPAASRAAQSA